MPKKKVIIIEIPEFKRQMKKLAREKKSLHKFCEMYADLLGKALRKANKR